MVSPVGLSAAASCAAIRAGISQFTELRYHDSHGEPVIGAIVPAVPLDFGIDERITEMLALAIVDCLQQCDAARLDEVPLLVGLPEAGRPGVSRALNQSAIVGIERRLGVRFHPRFSGTIEAGHTAGFRALQQARALCDRSGVSACLIAGADSFISRDAIAWLYRHGRLKTTTNSDGVIPGEAAAAALIDWTGRRDGAIGPQVIGLGFAQENATVIAEEPLLGRGLADAARIALDEAGVEMHEIDYRLSDVTGESYGFREHALAVTRLMRASRETVPTWHCADAIGDTGAAAGVCQIVIAARAWQRKYAPGSLALCLTSAVGGERGAVVLRQHAAGRRSS
jgi:3-oxoacyl-[acyl-carrier-protein] synthase-1